MAVELTVSDVAQAEPPGPWRAFWAAFSENKGRLRRSSS